MVFLRGNRAIKEHVKDGKDLHLFEQVGKGNVRYLGQMVCTSCQELPGRDAESRARRLIVFQLTPLGAPVAS
jgi:hypothetical protein